MLLVGVDGPEPVAAGGEYKWELGAFEAIDARYGSALNYLDRAFGIDPAARDRLLERLT